MYHFRVQLVLRNAVGKTFAPKLNYNKNKLQCQQSNIAKSYADQQRHTLPIRTGGVHMFSLRKQKGIWLFKTMCQGADSVVLTKLRISPILFEVRAASCSKDNSVSFKANCVVQLDVAQGSL